MSQPLSALEKLTVIASCIELSLRSNGEQALVPCTDLIHGEHALMPTEIEYTVNRL